VLQNKTPQNILGTTCYRTF